MELFAHYLLVTCIFLILATFKQYVSFSKGKGKNQFERRFWWKQNWWRCKVSKGPVSYKLVCSFVSLLIKLSHWTRFLDSVYTIPARTIYERFEKGTKPCRLRYFYTLRLIGQISYLGACYIQYMRRKQNVFVRKFRCMYFCGWTIKSHSPGSEIGPINRSVSTQL